MFNTGVHLAFPKSNKYIFYSRRPKILQKAIDDYKIIDFFAVG